MHTQNATYWIEHLKLQPHPEGGYYKEVFRSQQQVLRPDDNKAKQACTSIYYLLEGKDYSGFHRLASDEIWYFHKGEPLIIHFINENGLHTHQSFLILIQVTYLLLLLQVYGLPLRFLPRMGLR